MTITVGEREIHAPSEVSVAAALMLAGVRAFRRSVGGEARAPLCGMGVCHECRVTIDGVPHRRACLVPVRDGQHVNIEEPA